MHSNTSIFPIQRAGLRTNTHSYGQPIKQEEVVHHNTNQEDSTYTEGEYINCLLIKVYPTVY